MILVLGESTGSRPEAVKHTPTISGHDDHAWRQVGRCVYCECGERLYQGTIPAGHKTFTPPKKAGASEKMLELWGKL